MPARLTRLKAIMVYDRWFKRVERIEISKGMAVILLLHTVEITLIPRGQWPVYDKYTDNPPCRGLQSYDTLPYNKYPCNLLYLAISLYNLTY